MEIEPTSIHRYDEIKPKKGGKKTMAKRIKEEFTCVLDRSDVPTAEVVPLNVPKYSPRKLSILIDSIEKAQFIRTVFARSYNRTPLSKHEKEYLTFLVYLIDREC